MLPSVVMFDGRCSEVVHFVIFLSLGKPFLGRYTKHEQGSII